MNLSRINKQRGAVLAFSLVMLLLLTLVSVNMIQQNKSQIAVTGNSLQQTTAFTSIANALASAQSQINARRYKDTAAHTCNSAATNGIAPNWAGPTFATGTGISGSIKETYCITNYNSTTKTGNMQQCLYDSSGQPIGSGVPTSPNACDRLAKDGTTNSKALLCDIEVYTIELTFTDATTGANRTIQSKYEVDCHGDETAA